MGEKGEKREILESGEVGAEAARGIRHLTTGEKGREETAETMEITSVEGEITGETERGTGARAAIEIETTATATATSSETTGEEIRILTDTTRVTGIEEMAGTIEIIITEEEKEGGGITRRRGNMQILSTWTTRITQHRKRGHKGKERGRGARGREIRERSSRVT